MLLSLVGPLLNISPSAVAIALTGCVGLLALDRYGWQGKGGNLLIDLISGQSSEYRQRIIHHEAGHFLVAHLLGIPVESYTLSAWQGIKAGLPGLGGVVVDTSAIQEAAPNRERLTTQVLNHYSMIWMAGIAAEKQTFGSAQGGEDDKAQLRKLWELTSPKYRTSATAETQTRWAQMQANTLIETQSAAYKALVEAMSALRPVDECVAQIDARLIDTEDAEDAENAESTGETEQSATPAGA